MLELFPEGFEEVDHETDLELAAYANPGAEERFWQAFGPGAAADVEEGWDEAWKRFHRPVRVGRLWIGPPWEEPEPDTVAVVIDPGRAFGTGGHATTRLCLALLLERPPTGLVDLGCGSGVLAVAAAKLGFDPVVAVDADPVAVDVARATARANAAEIDVRLADVVADPLPETDVLVANIELQTVEPLLARAQARAAVTSGYLAADALDVPGWTTLERLELEGWAADALARAH
jgi:ribosomal protein L11 methyltransferase